MMFDAIRDRIAGALSILAQRFSVDPRYPAAARIAQSMRTLAGVTITSDTAITIATVWACLRYLSQTVAVLPWHVMRDASKGAEIVKTHPVDWLLYKRASDEWSSFQFRETLTHWALRMGNGYAEIERDQADRPYALWPIHPDRTQCCRATDDGIATNGRAILEGQLYYEVNNGSEAKTLIAAQDMFHVRGFGNGPVGVNVVTYAAQSLGWARAIQLFGASFFGNGMNIAGILVNKKPLQAAGYKRQRAELEALYKGPMNANKVALFDNDVDFKPIGIDPQKSQLVEIHQHLIEEVCFVPGTRIVTLSGPKSIETIEIGDRVLTHRGRWRRVTNIMSRHYVGSVITAQAKGMAAVTATANHPFYVQKVEVDRSHRLSVSQAPQWIEADKLAAARRQSDGRRARGCFDALTIPRLMIDQPVTQIDMAEWVGPDAKITESQVWVSHNCRATPVRRMVSADYDLGWLCGLFAADGSTSDHQVFFYLGAHEKNVIEQLRQRLLRVFDISVTTSLTGSVARNVISNRVLAAFFRDHGHSASQKCLPAWSMTAGEELRSGLIDGLVAGDGCDYHARRQLRTTSQALETQIRILLWSKGINSTVYVTAAGQWEINGRSGESLPIMTIEWCPEYVGCRGTMGLADSHVYFQLERADRSKYSGLVFNLEVEEDKSYTTTGGCVHNCRWFGVPPHKVAHLLRATFSNIEHQAIEVVVDSVSPWVKRFEDEADFKLFGAQNRQSLYTKMNMRALLRGDNASRVAYYDGMVKIGVYSPNDVLRKEDENTIGPQGDIHVMQNQNVTLDTIANPPEPPPPPAPALPPKTSEPPVAIRETFSADEISAQAKIAQLRRELENV
jgi:HK97 family phage portal protein